LENWLLLSSLWSISIVMHTVIMRPTLVVDVVVVVADQVFHPAISLSMLLSVGLREYDHCYPLSASSPPSICVCLSPCACLSVIALSIIFYFYSINSSPTLPTSSLLLCSSCVNRVVTAFSILTVSLLLQDYSYCVWCALKGPFSTAIDQRGRQR
jgi:hypothetical protein